MGIKAERLQNKLRNDCEVNRGEAVSPPLRAEGNPRALSQGFIRANCGAVVAEESGVIAGANCVGYVTATVEKNHSKTFSLSLTDCEKPNSPVRIDKLLSIDSLPNVAAWGDAMDQIWRWDEESNQWIKYGYQKPRSGTAAWRKYQYDGDKAFVDLTDDDVVKPGETFLYSRGGAETATVTLSGQVKEFGSEASYSIEKNHSAFIAYPWPIEIKVKDISTLATFSQLPNVAAWGDSMDQIWCWDAPKNQWAKYGYQKPRSGSAAWRKYNYDTDKSFSELSDSDVIHAGEGFLYARGGAETLIFTWKPLKSREE